MSDAITNLTRPDYVGIVSGAQYKIDGAQEGVTEYGLTVIVEGGSGWIFEMSEEDLRYLSRQIIGLIGERDRLDV